MSNVADELERRAQEDEGSPGGDGGNERFNDLTLLRKLNEGGMGELWLAKFEGPGGASKLVALKLIIAAYSNKENFIDAFENEMAISSSLSHPNILPVLRFGCWEGIWYMELEFVEGLDVRGL